MIDSLIETASGIRDSTVLFAVAAFGVLVGVAFFRYLEPGFAVVPAVLAVGAGVIGAKRRFDGD